MNVDDDIIPKRRRLLKNFETETCRVEESSEKSFLISIIFQALEDLTTKNLNPKYEKFKYDLIIFKSALDFLTLKNSHFLHICTLTSSDPTVIVRYLKNNEKFKTNLRIYKDHCYILHKFIFKNV